VVHVGDQVRHARVLLDGRVGQVAPQPDRVLEVVRVGLRAVGDRVPGDGAGGDYDGERREQESAHGSPSSCVAGEVRRYPRAGRANRLLPDLHSPVTTRRHGGSVAGMADLEMRVPGATAEVRVTRLPAGASEDDLVAVEEPLEIRVDGEPVAVTMR